MFACALCVFAEKSEGAFTVGSQWLVWKFESDATLGDALDGRLGAFPGCLEEFTLGKVNPNLDEDKRDTMVREHTHTEIQAHRQAHRRAHTHTHTHTHTRRTCHSARCHNPCHST